MRKGQFFMVGTLLVAIIIFVVIGIRGSAFITGDAESNTRNYFVRGVEEFPRAVDSALKENREIENLRKALKNYMDFLDYSNSQRGLSADYYFMAGIRRENSYDIVFGNFMDESIPELNITLDGNRKEYSDVRVGTFTDSFSTGSEDFRASVEFGEKTRSVRVLDRNFYFIQGIAEGTRGVWRRDISSK
mgnify:CR=1 FL=1